MKVLVTGGAGFIGSHIVEELIQNGIDTVVVDNLSTGRKEYLPKNVPFYKMNVESQEIEGIFKKEKPDFLIHQAAQVDVAKSIKTPFFDASSNILGTINLLNLSKKYRVKKFVYASSCAVYGETDHSSIKEDYTVRPISFYDASKYTPEIYLRLYQEIYNLPYMILRYANVYGPRQTSKGEGGVISFFISKLLKGDVPTIYGSGEQTRDFVYVKDVAKANYLSLLRGENKVINIGCNQSTSINQLYKLLADKLAIKYPPTYSSKRHGDILFSKLDNQAAAQAINWKSNFPLSKGLDETILYYSSEDN